MMARSDDPEFPRFDNLPEGGGTAWYTMQITRIANAESSLPATDLADIIKLYEQRDRTRHDRWSAHFGR
jgi:hypothetical protein